MWADAHFFHRVYPWKYGELWCIYTDHTFRLTQKKFDNSNKMKLCIRITQSICNTWCEIYLNQEATDLCVFNKGIDNKSESFGHLNFPFEAIAKCYVAFHCQKFMANQVDQVNICCLFEVSCESRAHWQYSHRFELVGLFGVLLFQFGQHSMRFLMLIHLHGKWSNVTDRMV